MSEKHQQAERELKGLPVSKGIAQGEAFVMLRRELDTPVYEIRDSDNRSDDLYPVHPDRDRIRFLCIPPQHADGYRFRIRRSCDRSDHGDRNELSSDLPLHKGMDVDRWSLHRHRFCNTGMDPSPAA